MLKEMLKPHPLTDRKARILDVVEGLLVLAGIVVAVWIVVGLAAPKIAHIVQDIPSALGYDKKQ